MSVYKDKKTKKYNVRVSYKDKNGKYKQKNKNGFDTKKEAELYESKLKIELDENRNINKDRIVFADYYADWVTNKKINTGLSAITEQKNKYEIKCVKAFFGDSKLVDLTRRKYQEYIDSRGKGNGKDITQKAHGNMQGVVKQALADGLIAIDPSHDIVVRYDNDIKKRISYLNLDEAKILNQHVSENKSMNNLMVYIALNTGLRIGEIYGLSRFDINKETLSVNRGYDYNITKDFTDGKNNSSIRTIAINKAIYDYCREWGNKHCTDDNPYLFLDNHYNPLITHNGINKHIKRTCRELGISEVTFHILRHTHCSILIYQDVNINYISKRLGHKSTVETLSTYSHIINELSQTQDDKTINILNTLLESNAE